MEADSKIGERYSTVGWNLRENFNYQSAFESTIHDPSNYLKDGKFTIGFSVAKKADVPFVTGSKCYMSSKSNGSAPIFTADGATLKYGDTVIATIREFTGDAPTQSDYTTFYMVFDVNANTVTVRRDDGTSTTLPIILNSTTYTDFASWLELKGSEVQGFYWDIPGSSGEAYINRITYMVGDIFS